MLEFEIIGEGKTAKILREGERAYKLYPSGSEERIKDEIELQSYARKAGLPVPEAYGVKRMEEGPALEMDYIPGRTLVWPRMDRIKRKEAFQSMVTLQCTIHKVDAQGLPRMNDRLAHKIKTNPLLEKATADGLLRWLNGLDEGKTSLCHGDFHPMNILNDGEKLWVIDWRNAASGDPLADACRTYLILQAYLSRLANYYLRLFCKAAEVHQEDVFAWLPVMAAERLTEKTDKKETGYLIDLIHKYLASRS